MVRSKNGLRIGGEVKNMNGIVWWIMNNQYLAGMLTIAIFIALAAIVDFVCNFIRRRVEEYKFHKIAREEAKRKRQSPHGSRPKEFSEWFEVAPPDLRHN